MRFRRWWNSLSFFWQVYLFMALSFGFIAALVEGVLEPGAAYLLSNLAISNPEFYEGVFWVIGTLLPTLFVGYALTRLVRKKLEYMDRATRMLARGDLKARIPEGGDARDVFNRLAVNFNSMADFIEQHLSNEKRLLADISHELRSPLTRMNVATALLSKKRDDDGFETLVRNLETEIEHMNNLVGTLLQQGRARMLEHEGRSGIDLSDMIADVANGYRTVAREGGVDIDSQIESGLYVFGNPVRLRMILENILGNATFYAPAGSAIDVRAGTGGDSVRLSVRDYGPGVPEENLGDIFRAFFRVDDSRSRNSGGVGLGLTLAKEAVLAMGGGIEARNAGPGLEVTVVFPGAKENGGCFEQR